MQKIQAQHQQRLAIVYVRQSSPTQVKNNQESRRRQQALQQRAADLGWPPERILVLQEEKGTSATSTVGRPAYHQLLEKVVTKQAGMILAVDTARWAREGTAWQMLLRDCMFFDVLLADEQTIYNPGDANDHVLLGIQGALAEYELRKLRERMLACWWNKAERGELFFSIPTGYVLRQTPSGGATLEKHPHRRVQNVIELMFQKFRQLPSVYQLWQWFLEHDQLLPYVPGDDPHHVTWGPATYKRLLGMLKNPRYSGAYVVGCTQTVLQRDASGEQVRRRKAVPREQWRVLEKDSFPAYISWQQFEQNLAKIERNAIVPGPATRRGVSLLSGLLRCRRCGHGLNVEYSRSPYPRYVCRNGKPQRQRGPDCLSFSGAAAEPLFSQMVLEAVQPAAVEASRRAVELKRQEAGRHTQTLADHLEQLRYEADRAKRQYDRVEPENRLVTAELEARWNQALMNVAQGESRLEALQREEPVDDPQETAQLLSLGTRLEDVWYAGADRLKKQIVDLLVEEIVVDVNDTGQEALLVIHWAGGLHTELTVPRRVRGGSVAARVKSLIRALRSICDDASIAQTLNRNRVGHGEGSWTADRVAAFRRREGIAAFDAAEKQTRGLLSQQEAAVQLGISPMSVHRLMTAGVLPAEQPAPGFPCIVQAADLQRPEVQQAVHCIQAHLPRPLPEDPNQLKLF